ncbi:MAG: 2,3-bisphosphoglycerate-dependent phosphoglycerate mutase [Solirubrobacteraceae bacterium]|jgi:broad specificity phosphatase PhoE|nr:2,3-bisphosphoglycerate-dependent phosphoglycerate mutase [Solirubrobacteraceae bacterium]
MAESNEILLVRHGETDENLADRFQGQLDPRLNDRGREQSRQLAASLEGEGLVALYSSPLLRARETAEIVGAHLGLEAVLDARLMEADTGDWTGALYAEVIATAPDGFRAWRRAERSFRFPGGESVAEQGVRVAAALADVRAAGLPALVVTHGGAIRAVTDVVARGDFVGNCALYRLSEPVELAP